MNEDLELNYISSVLEELFGEGWENLSIEDAKHFQVICKYCGYPVGKWQDKITRNCIHQTD